jgi:hypothetical protein
VSSGVRVFPVTVITSPGRGLGLRGAIRPAGSTGQEGRSAVMTATVLVAKDERELLTGMDELPAR